MPPYSDVYVLALERSAATADCFLETFAPVREQSAEDYTFPQHAQQLMAVIKSAAVAIRYCETHPFEAQSFYFRNLGDGPAHAMLFFTRDGGMILGLSVEEDEDNWFALLKAHAGSEVGYSSFEAPPAETEAEFRRVAASVA